MNMTPAIALDPIHQFEITKWLDLRIGSVDISFTNSSGFMLLGVILVISFFVLATHKAAVVPGRLQSVAEIGYTFISDMIRGTAGEEGLKFFPFLFTLFFFILFANLIGMVPYAFTTTSHITVTLALALTVIVTVIVTGLLKNGLGFFKLFAPSGAPWYIYIILIPIEIMSFLTRPITLGLRLFASMLAGHILLKLFAGFTVMLVSAGVIYIPVALLAFGMGIALNALEFLVAGLQAYVFAILSSVYLNDALHADSH